MIVNFYKRNSNIINDYKLLISKNIDPIPQKGTFIKYSGQIYMINGVYLNIDKGEYDIYIIQI